MATPHPQHHQCFIHCDGAILLSLIKMRTVLLFLALAGKLLTAISKCGTSWLKNRGMVGFGNDTLGTNKHVLAIPGTRIKLGMYHLAL